MNARGINARLQTYNIQTILCAAVLSHDFSDFSRLYLVHPPSDISFFQDQRVILQECDIIFHTPIKIREGSKLQVVYCLGHLSISRMCVNDLGSKLLVRKSEHSTIGMVNDEHIFSSEESL